MLKSLRKTLATVLGASEAARSNTQGVGCGNVSRGNQSIRIDGDIVGGNAGSGNVSDGDQRIQVGGRSRSSNAPRSSPMSQQIVAVTGSFSKIDQAGGFDVEWEASSEVSVVIHAEEHVLAMMDVHVRRDTLVVTSKPGDLIASKRIVIIAKSPSVVYAKTSGSGDIELTGVSSDSLTVEIAGSGDISASGKTGELSVSIAGSGDFDGSSLQAENAQLTIAGSGDINAKARQNVQATIMGSGDIKVHGAAGSRNTRVMGSGDIRFK